MDDLIRVYGASWCNDCRRAKKFLADQRVSYEWHDIEQDPSLISVVQERNDGKNIIPTIVFPDGSHLSEPTNEELANKLGSRADGDAARLRPDHRSAAGLRGSPRRSTRPGRTWRR